MVRRALMKNTPSSRALLFSFLAGLAAPALHAEAWQVFLGTGGPGAKGIYRADGVDADKSIKDQLKVWEAAGYGHLPVCMAKTQYSFTTDPNTRGAPTGFTIPVREVRLSAGAGFIVAICGEIMTMPGLPKVPSAEVIRLNDQGFVEGLF